MRKWLIALFWLCCSTMPVQAAGMDWHELPDGICAKYAAAEFEKTAPVPGVNWLKTNYDWVVQANEAGWHVATTVRDAREGAIVEWQTPDRKNGHVAVVRKILADRIIVEEHNVGAVVGEKSYRINGKNYNTSVTEGWGKTTMRAIKFDEMLKMDQRVFVGYIWPVRQDDFMKNPEQYQRSMVDSLKIAEPKYKGFNEYWGPALLLREFDKVAAEPGCNWRGNVDSWVNNAQSRGWVVKRELGEAMVGALSIRYNQEKNMVKVGIVREMTAETVTLDSRDANLYPRTTIVMWKELKQVDAEGYKFIGYIWPMRA